MAQYPLRDLAQKFAGDVQAVFSGFQTSVSAASIELERRLPGLIEAEASALELQTRRSGSGASSGKIRLEAAAVDSSPLKTGKLDLLSQPATASAFSPCVSREGSWPARTRSAEPGATAPIESVQGAPRPQVVLLAAASPAGKKGSSLLDAMRARGTFGPAPAQAATPPHSALVPAANIVAADRGRMQGGRSSSESGQDGDPDEARRPEKVAPHPISFLTATGSLPAASASGSAEAVRVPKRPRQNSMVALYKEIVEPNLHIGDFHGDVQASTVTPLKGKVALAKKFRRSSMLKQAAAAREIQWAARGPAVTPQPLLLGKVTPQPLLIGKEKATQASASTSSAMSPGSIPRGTMPSPGKSESSGPDSVKKPPKKTARPPVPMFSSPREEQPWFLLRQACPLSPKRDEENYEISEKDENSDAECEEPDRSHKHVPKWCSTYLETLATQSSIDPDGIFGSKVPRCDLDTIFSNESYKKYKRERPQRRRGSSGEWKKDRLRPNEIRDYKRKMGQTKAWNATLKSPGAPQAGARGTAAAAH